MFFLFVSFFFVVSHRFFFFPLVPTRVNKYSLIRQTRRLDCSDSAKKDQLEKYKSQRYDE